MKISVKSVIYIVVGLLICWLIIFTQIKCNKLQKQLNEEKIKRLEQVDSLNYINKQHLDKIKTYELKVSELNLELDSLQHVKNKIIVKKDGVIVSKNASIASKQLKQNLEV